MSIAAALERDEAIEPILGQMIRLGGASSKITPQCLAGWLARRAPLVGAAQAVAELESWLTATRHCVQVTLFIGTAKPTEHLSINGVTTLAPATWQQAQPRYNWVSGAYGSPWAQIGAVIKVTPPYPKIMWRTEDERNTVDGKARRALDEAYRLADEVRWSLSLAMEAYVPAIIRVTDFGPDVPTCMGGSSEAFFPTARRGWVPVTAQHVGRCQQFLNGLMNSNPDERVALDSAIGRLASTFGRESLADSCLDVGTTLETLLLTGESKTEIAFRLALHAARFLGADAAERLDIVEAVQKFYRLRSQAAHAGRVQATPSETALIGAATTLAIRVFEKVASAGRRPSHEEWKKIILG